MNEVWSKFYGPHVPRGQGEQGGGGGVSKEEEGPPKGAQGDWGSPSLYVAGWKQSLAVIPPRRALRWRGQEHGGSLLCRPHRNRAA